MADELLQSQNVVDYLNKIDILQKRENYNAELWLKGNTKEKLDQLFIQQFITQAVHILETKEGGFYLNYFDRKNKSTLHNLYQVYAKGGWHCHLSINSGLAKYIKYAGEKITTDNEKHLRDPVLFTQQMLILMDNVNEMIADCFMSNEQFCLKRDEAFKVLINSQALCPSYFAMYVDSAMQWRGDFMGKDEDFVVERFNKIIRLVQYC